MTRLWHWFKNWLDRASRSDVPPCYAFYDGLKVYGDTEEDRQRVLGYLTHLRYKPWIKRDSVHPQATHKEWMDLEDKIKFDPATIDKAAQFIRFFCPNI